MRYFSNWPADAKCPLCKTSEEGECFLVPIEGTQSNGNMEAIPVHKDCIEAVLLPALRYNRQLLIIYADI